MSTCHSADDPDNSTVNQQFKVKLADQVLGFFMQIPMRREILGG